MPRETRLSRALVVHNRYQISGGEEACAAEEVKLLSDMGIEVQYIELDNSDIVSPIDKISVAANIQSNRRYLDRYISIVSSFDPQLVSVHNFFPIGSPAIFEVAREHGAATCWTVHNYRYACLNGLFLRNNAPCEDCLGKSPWRGVMRGCYRDSPLASLPVMNLINGQIRSGKMFKNVDIVIALNNFTKEKMSIGGVPEEKIFVSANYLSEAALPPLIDDTGRGDYFLFVGRMSEEKGVDVLVDMARLTPDILYIFAGEGPLLGSLAASAPQNCKFIGVATPAEVAALMRNAVALLAPSRFYECFPRVLIEAAAAHLPTIGADAGSIGTIIRDYSLGETVVGYDPGRWAAAVRKFSTIASDAQRDNVRAQFERNFTAHAAKARWRSIFSKIGFRVAM